MINKPPPLIRDDNMDPNITALKSRGFINYGSTLFELQPMFPSSFNGQEFLIRDDTKQ